MSNTPETGLTDEEFDALSPEDRAMFLDFAKIVDPIPDDGRYEDDEPYDDVLDEYGRPVDF